MNPEFSIAIVGLGARFADAPDPDAFWRLVRDGRDAARDTPPERWIAPIERMLDPHGRPDRAWTRSACLLTPFEPDFAGLNVDASLTTSDALLGLTLHVGAQAWRSADMPRRAAEFDPSRIGVYLAAIALPTDGSSAWTRRTRGARLARASLGPDHPLSRILAETPADPHDTQACAAPAEMLARAIGARGPRLTLDAACASSLYAIKLACDVLREGRLDLVLAGGVSRPECLYTQVGFTQLQALSRSGRCRPFDAAADGLIVGEGAGLFVLRRLDDALRDGDRIHGVIRGVGLSNDTAGSLLAADSAGQLRAMRAAYEQAGWRPHDVRLIECHGTGTPKGDATELQSLHTLWRDAPPERRAALGSAKANVGHTLTAAGAAGLLRVILAIRAGELPPAANFERPAEALRRDGPFECLRQAAPWPDDANPRRAAVSAFGFGGINAHLLLESPPSESTAKPKPDGAPRTNTDPQHAATNQQGNHRPDAQPIAVVGLAARCGALENLDAYAPHMLAGRPLADEQRAAARVRLTPGRFRLPPSEAPDLLGQQLLMLTVAADALEDARAAFRGERVRDGLFIGIQLDPRTSDHHLHWACPELGDNPRPLTPQRVLGALGGITASRIAREFGFGGPAYTLSAGRLSGIHGLNVALQALRRGELDLALVGAVELTCDERLVAARPATAPADAAAAIVLKRLADAERDGDSIHAVIESIDFSAADAIRTHAEDVSDNATAPDQIKLSAADAPSDTAWRGDAGAAHGLLTLVDACLCLRERVRPGSANGRQAPYPCWTDAPERPRFALATTRDEFGHTAQVRLREHDSSLPRGWLRRGGHVPAVFLLSGDHADQLAARAEELLADGNRLEASGSDNSAAGWWRWAVRHGLNDSGPARPGGPRAAVIARNRAELADAVQKLTTHLRATPDLALDERSSTPYAPAALEGELAFVFPGSGVHAPDMGRAAALAFPEIVIRLEAETAHLRSQLRPAAFERWAGETAAGVVPHPPPTIDAITAQVAFGVLAADVLRAIGLRPQAAMGYSLGETTALFALRAWPERDKMFARLAKSPLFRSELAGRCDAARRYWKLEAGEAVEWTVAVVPRDADVVRDALRDEPHAFLLIVNAPGECVVGGRRAAVTRLARKLNCDGAPVHGASSVHCPIALTIRDDYRALHLLPTDAPAGIRFYSAATAAAYDVTADSAADAITALATAPFDFTAVVERAYADGARCFVELGPGAACSRMIGRVLADRSHVALAAFAGDDETHGLARTVARLAVLGLLPDLRGLYAADADWAEQASAADHAAEPIIVQLVESTEPVSSRKSATPPASADPFVSPESNDIDQSVTVPIAIASHGIPVDRPAPFVPFATRSDDLHRLTIEAATAVRSVAQAHDRFMTLRAQALDDVARTVALQARLAGFDPRPEASASSSGALPAPIAPDEWRPVFTFDDCMEFARGRVANVFGPDYAVLDADPVRTRLPDEPLMLVHRVTALDAAPGTLSRGTITTEHDVWHGAWYLDNGRAPVCISVEAGQADMFLAAYLGIDFKARGQRAYRLLDAEIAFHRELPGVGETIRYDIRIHRFVNNGPAWLFFFEFDATISGRPLLTMRNGCAGYFNEQEIERSGGIVETAEESVSRPGRVTGGYQPLIDASPMQLSDEQVDALRRGDLAAAFGPPFDRLALRDAVRIPGGLMRLVHRVVDLDPRGGRYGLGVIRAEADVAPDDWFLTCHFVDDMVMPGTLMYECCAHALRILLSRLGWIGEHDEIHYEPVPGVTTKLRCRGPVTPRTRVVTYEVMIKEIGWTSPPPTTDGGQSESAAPYVIADAYMYADGRRIVRFVDMSMRLAGTSRERLEATWGKTGILGRAAPKCESDPQPAPIGTPELPDNQVPALYDYDRILAFAVGDPAVAFGDRYRVFSSGEKRIARLPGPPYAFLSRITQVHAPPWQLERGAWIEAQYDVPPDAWYFAANRQPVMPFSVLLEIPLQACGWLAAHGGAALLAEHELFFRNLGGTAVLHQEISPESGTLTIRVRQTDVSLAGGMILVRYDLQLWKRRTLVYGGETQFGFFSGAALANQVGIRDAAARRYTPSDNERARHVPFPLSDIEPHTPIDQPPPSADAPAGMPGKALRMIDEIELLIPNGGPHGCGFVRGVKHVDPGEWLFQAHFYRDPVVPGSLGLESFLQLMKAALIQRFPRQAAEGRFEPIAVGKEHTWIYRGQIIPSNRRVEVEVVAREVVAGPEPLMIADGFLSVDGKAIYEMRDFGLRLRRRV